MKENNFTREELELIKKLEEAGLPADFLDTVCKDIVEVDRKTTNAIEKATLAKIRPSVPVWHKVRLPAAAVLFFVLLITVVLGPQRILAGISGLVRFVPGFGLEEAEQFTLAMPEPIRVTRGDTVYDITGFLVTDEYSLLNIKAEGYIQNADIFLGKYKDQDGNQLPYLEDVDGVRYTGSYNSVSHGGILTGVAWGSFSFEPLPPQTQRIYLVLPDYDGGTWNIEIPLVDPDHLVAAEDLQLRQYQSGVAVTAMHQLRHDESVVTLLIQTDDPQAVVSEVGDSFFPMPHGNHATLKDQDGGEYSLIDKGNNTGYQSRSPYELRFSPADSSATSLQLSIPQIHFEKWGINKKVKLTVPSEGIQEMNQEIELDRFTATVIAAERISPTEVRFHIDPGPADQEYLRMFWPDIDCAIRTNKQTGQMEYIDLSVEPEQKSLKLTIDRLSYVTNGPWQFEIPLD
jgi:hypothetical protein